MIRRCRFAVAVAATLAVTQPVMGQTVWAGASAETYRFSGIADAAIDEVQLVAMPFGVAWAPVPWMTLDGVGAWGRGIATFPQGGSSEIQGLTDFRVRLALSNRALWLSAIASLPGGGSTRTTDELLMAGILGSELLGFQLRSFGSGGALGAMGGFRRSLGTLEVGLSAGYVIHNDFMLLDAPAELYRPGAQTRYRATVSSPFGAAGVVSMHLGHQRSSLDEYGGVRVLRPGTRSEGLLLVTLPVGARESLVAYGGYYERGSDGLGTVDGLFSTQRLPGLVATEGRANFVAGVEAQATRTGMVVLPSMEFRMSSTNDEVGAGWLATVGVDVDYRLAGPRRGRRVVVSPGLAGQFGSVRVGSSGNARVIGAELSVRVQWMGGS